MTMQEILLAVVVCAAMCAAMPAQSEHPFNGPYTGRNLDRTAFPIGGIGAGMYCIEGTGAISHMSVRNTMEFAHEPCTFAAVCVLGDAPVARVLEGPIPDWKYFGKPGAGNGLGNTTYGLPRFHDCVFEARFPFASIQLRDAAIPLEAAITGWSPFIPGDSDNSGLPVGAIEYAFHNPMDKAIDAVFSFNARNFMSRNNGRDRIRAFDNGFLLWQEGAPSESDEGAFAVWAEGGPATVDHCWFIGGWWDALTLTWRNIATGTLRENPPLERSAPGASLFVPITVAPGATETVRLMTAWYVPSTSLRIGGDPPGAGVLPENAPGAFGDAPSSGTGNGQQPVSGFLGEGLVNTFDPHGDAAAGVLASPRFRVNKRYLHFLIGGGAIPGATCAELYYGTKCVRSAAGANAETLTWHTWDLEDLEGKKLRIRIADRSVGSWGHVNADHFILSDEPIAALLEDDAVADPARVAILADFEQGYGDWKREKAAPASESAAACAAACCAGQTACCAADQAQEAAPEAPKTHVPWYAGRFASVEEVAAYWRENAGDLRARSEEFRDAFYAMTLPPEVIEAVAANLTILKSPTVMRQTDGRLWCWEGCCDGSGCCHGSCTHVWNYAQAISHLFPDLERTLRWTEFHESQDDRGHQTFRSSLPIRPVGHGFHAASDGQLGGIMKVHREWRVSGDGAWLATMWPRVKQSLDYCIATWDPRETGALEEPHHNTYDIEYWGPDGHCGTFYLGALEAAVRMGQALGKDVARYAALAGKARAFLEEQLYNGEYFFQKIQTEDLDAAFNPLDASANGSGYADLVALLNEQGPRYQYGTGCLSDGVLGLWIAKMCGIETPLLDPAKVRSHLAAIHKYNLKHDLSAHANPQRPTFAMGDDGGLLLCTWPRGGALAIPFVYSDEVWTGIEYQAASHMMIEGLVEEGLEVVRVCRKRYDGVRRNPFNEYECGHWYARAMSSYCLLEGLTGVRYDAVDKTLYIDSRIGGTFRVFLATATGYGLSGLEAGKPVLEVVSGEVDVARVIVSGNDLGDCL